MQLENFCTFINMMTLGGEILFGSLSFIIDDSTWLQDAPQDTYALPA